MGITEIKIYIDTETISVDGDKEIPYKLSRFYMERLKKEETLSNRDLQSFGFEIFDNIFSTQKRREGINHLLEHLPDNENLILTISSEFEDTHNIPFEIINKDGSDSGFLLKKGNISLVRDIPSLDKNITPASSPIRILVLLSLPLETYATFPIDPLKELNVIYKALDPYIRRGALFVDVEINVTIPRIRESLVKKNYQIIHFIGHGARGGKLVIEDESDTTLSKLIGAEELRDIFKGGKISLFYFDACASAGSTELDPSLASHIYRGIPSSCVIANLVSVRDDIATNTSEHIYKTLFETSVIGALLNSARLKIPEEWWKPVLFAKPLDRIFHISDEEKRKRVILSPKETGKNYVYRYGIVRRASDLMEKGNYLVLHGIGGTGKSVMANYLSRFFDAKFTHILFFDLKELCITGPEGLLDNILRLLRKEKLIDTASYKKIREDTKGLNLEERIIDKWEFVMGHLKESALLILDNMEETIQESNGLLRAEWREIINDIFNTGNIFTIFTTRIKPLLTERQRLDNIIVIEEYTEAEVEFLCRDLGVEEKRYMEKNKETLLRTFGNHPLSMNLAIEQKSYDCKKLLKLKEFHNVFSFYKEYFNEYGEEARRLFFLPYPFTIRFLETFFSADFISLIKEKLILLEKNDLVFAPYPVLRSYFKDDFEIAKDELITFKDEITKEYDEAKFVGLDMWNIFYILLNYYDLTGDRDVEKKIVDSFYHCNFGACSITGMAKPAIEALVKRLDGFSIGEESLARTCISIGIAYITLAEFDKAINFFERALGIGKKYSEKNHPDIAIANNGIGRAYLAKGMFSKAINFYKTALDIREKKMGKDHPDTAEIYSNMGEAYDRNGESEQAFKFFKSAINIRESVLGKSHVDTAKTYHDMGRAYQNAGEGDRAIEFYKLALSGWHETSKYNYNTGSTYNSIGTVYFNKGEYDRASEFYNNALNIWKKIGENNLYMADTYQGMGMLYKVIGKYDRAIEYFSLALKIREEKLGRDHPDTASSYSDVGETYYCKEEYKEAIESCALSLNIREARFGKDHPVTASSYNIMGRIYQAKGDTDKAIEFLKLALNVMEEKLGPTHPNTASAYNNIAMAFRDQKEYGNAIKYYDKALIFAETKLDKYHPNKAIAYNNIAALHQAKGEHDKAIENYAKALDIYQNRDDYSYLFSTYPYLINLLAKSNPTDFPFLAECISGFLELFDIFQKDGNGALELNFFTKEKTFEHADKEKIKKAMKYPVDRDRLDNFFNLLESLSTEENDEIQSV